MDPVRYISNESSGKQGYEIAEALSRLGIKTTLITGPSHLSPKKDIKTKKIVTANEMFVEVKKCLPVDIAICAAAVADFKPIKKNKFKIKKENIKLKTNTATIGIRGTDFTVTVDELDRTLVILLPDKNGESLGEITVTNEGGTVTLNQAFQATIVSTISSPPASPVQIENITVAQIDNLFIVSPPEEIQQVQEEARTENSSNNILTADFLEFNELEKDYLEEETDWSFSELDIDLLDVDFLQDLLLIIEESDLLSRKSAEGFDGIMIEGTQPGLDPDTQYNTIIEDTGFVWFYRQVDGIISIRIPIDSNAYINTVTDQKESIITVGDGTSAMITITQVQ